MDDLVTWLRAQLDDDAQVADACAEAFTGPSELVDLSGLLHEDARRHVYRWSPARVLAETDAKRRILDLHAPEPSHYIDGRFVHDEPGEVQCEYCASLCHSRSGLSCDTPDAPWPCPTVQLLALPYADRPGYRDEWRDATRR